MERTSAPPAAAKARKKAPAKPQPKAGTPAPRDITRYDPKLFGPEVALAQIVKRLGIETTAEGRIPNARVVVLKRERRLELFAGDTFLKAYRMQLGRTPVGAKEKLKDGRTPEGEYVICAHKPSKYHRGLWLNYPNAADAERGVRQKLITETQRRHIEDALAAGKCPPQTTKLGGYLMLHGQDPTLTSWLARAQRKGLIEKQKGREPGDGNPRNLEEVWDWTQGCIALLNPDVRELYQALPDGTPVSIRAGGSPTPPGRWPPSATEPAQRAGGESHGIAPPEAGRSGAEEHRPAEQPGGDGRAPGTQPQPTRAD